MTGYDYVANIVRRYRINQNAVPLENAQATFESLLGDIHHLKANILQSHGYGEGLNQADTLNEQVHLLTRALNDICSYVQSGDFEEAYMQGHLLYLKLL